MTPDPVDERSDATTRYRLATDAAEFYESTFVPALFAEWAQRLTSAAEPVPGTALLDVACGTGIVARTAADVVGAGTRVVGLDLNPAMLAVARRIAPGLAWQEGDAAALPFADATFGRVVCQGALMFFPDPVAALREMGRVATADGRVAVLVPGRLSHSPGYLALAEVVAVHAGPAARDLVASYFSVGDPQLLTDLMSRAGLGVERLQTWTGATRLPSVQAFLEVELLPLAQTLTADIRARLVADATRALAPFVDAEGRIAAPLEVHIVST